MNLLAVFDLDQTLADSAKRLAGAPPKHHRRRHQEWLNGAEAGDSVLHDDVFIEGYLLAKILAETEGVKICYVTARQEKLREYTQAWLKKHGFPTGQLFMKPDGDGRPNGDFKIDKTREAVRTLRHKGRVVVFDDDHVGDASELYIEAGYYHLKVQAV